jgi:ketosteroid isomerase-like protein
MLVVVAVFAVAAASCARTVDVEQEKAGLMAVDAEWSRAATDLDKFVSFFVPEGTVALAHMPAVSGQQAIRDAFEPMMKAPGFDLSWQATRADVSASGDLAAGSYAVLSADMPHYVVARGATVVQIHGMGPFVLNYVNPADDPSKK